MRQRLGQRLFLMLALVFSPGCAVSSSGTRAAPPARGDFAIRRIPNVSLPEVDPVAARVFRSHFRVDAEASTANRLISRPTEIEGRGEPHNIRDRISLSPARRRQIAELGLEPQVNAVAVQIRVTSQRLEVTERAAFARDRGDDRPNTTAIDRSGPTSVDQRQEWVTMGRDRKTELMVLDEIQSALAPASQPASAPP